MLTWLPWLLAGLTGALALGVVLLERPARSTGMLIATVATTGSLLMATGAPEVGALMIWMWAGGVGLLLLLLSLLLNLSVEEMGGRRVRLQPFLLVIILGWLAAAGAGTFSEVARPTPRVELSGARAAAILLEEQGFLVGLAGLALLATLVSTLVVVRRRG